ncbi:MAG: hypothetical protein HY401_06595 [Elusimicrobia bacterium]|nr:hypothetical protein [Elusimicrobiota bacterium]
MRILILRLSSLGDVALLSPVFEDIKRVYPQAHIACLVKPAYAGLVASSAFVDEVLVFEGFWPTLKLLRSKKWDAILDLHAVLRTRLLAALVVAKRKITYRKNILGRLRMVLKGVSGESPVHVAERYKETLKPLGVGLKRAVVLQTAFLGDAILTLPLLSRVKSELQPESLAVVTRPEHEAMFAREGFRVIVDDKRGQDGGIGGIFRMIRRLRKENFDLALVPHRSLRSAVIAWGAGIGLRVGFESSAGSLFFNKTVPFEWPIHDSERNLRLFEKGSLGPAGNGQAFKISIKPEDRQRARKVWETFGVDPAKEFLVGILPGSKWATKRWLPERFGQAALKLSELHPNCRAVFFGGPEDRALCDQIAGWVGGNALNLAGKVAIGNLPALIADLKLFVSNDSGPMHLAYGSGVPTVAIFGPTIQGFGFFPQGPASRVVEVRDLECRPCGLHGGDSCPQGHFLCMRLITVGQVIKACEEATKQGERGERSQRGQRREGISR